MKKLSRNDILALKQADHILISGPILPERQNSAVVLCTKKKGSEQHAWEVSIASTVVFLDDSLKESNLQCQFLIVNSYINWHWQTCTGSLVPGDELELLWLPDVETTAELLQKDIHVDLLKVVVYRQTFRYHYLIGLSASSDQRLIRGLTKPLKEELILPNATHRA